jgi:Mrp family chromosome partitioning ATPase
MFTSPDEGSGKTTTVARLAPALVDRSGGEVLVVDANFANPELAVRLGIEASVGLGEVLAGETTWSAAVRPTSVPRLSLLASGRQAAGMASPVDLGGLLKQFTERYAIVLVDAGSLLQPDAVSLMPFCDGAYLVVRLGRTSRRLISEAARVIERAGGRLLGCVAIE